MKVIKKMFALAAAVSFVCLSAVGAMAADKLIVKDSTGNANKFVVTDSGYIGVGGVSPTMPLQIVGAGAYSTTTLYLENTGRATGKTAVDAPHVYMLRSNDASINTGLPQAGDRLGAILFGSKLAGAIKTASFITSNADSAWNGTSTPGYLSFFTTIAGSTTATEALRITSNGNVGIGLISPTQKLQVNGGVKLYTSTAKPACTDATNRGTIWFALGASGVKDSLEVCAKDAANNYAWRSIY